MVFITCSNYNYMWVLFYFFYVSPVYMYMYLSWDQLLAIHVPHMYRWVCIEGWLSHRFYHLESVFLISMVPLTKGSFRKIPKGGGGGGGKSILEDILGGGGGE